MKRTAAEDERSLNTNVLPYWRERPDQYIRADSRKRVGLFVLKARGSAAAPRWSFNDGDIFREPSGRVPRAWASYVASGALEVVTNPGSGFDPVVVSPRWFEDEPAEPVPEETVSLQQVLAFGDWSVAEWRTLRAQYGAPAAVEYVGGASAEHPDRESEPRWFLSAIQRWLSENPMLRKAHATAGEK